MQKTTRLGFLGGVGAAAATFAAFDPLASLATPSPAGRGQIDPSGHFGALLDSKEFEQAPRVLSPELLVKVAPSEAAKNISAPAATPGRRYVLSGLPPVMMQGTTKSLGFPGSCEAMSFGYGLGTYTASRGATGFDPQAGPANQISAAWLFGWAQQRKGVTGCKGSQALPYLELLVAKGAPNALQVPYESKCTYLDGLTAPIDGYPGIARFAIGSYKALPKLRNGKLEYLDLMKRLLDAGHAIAFSGLVANGYADPGAAMVNGAFAPTGFIADSGHGQLLVGYDDSLGDEGAFLVQNSFGTDWPYLSSPDPLLRGRLWWTYEAFFNSQSLGAIAYPLPPAAPYTGAVPLASANPSAPAGHIIEAHRASDATESYVVCELRFAQPVQLGSIRVTKSGATSPVVGPYRAPISYGFAHVSQSAPFAAGLYTIELDAHTLTADLTPGQPMTYQAHLEIS